MISNINTPRKKENKNTALWNEIEKIKYIKKCYLVKQREKERKTRMKQVNQTNHVLSSSFFFFFAVSVSVHFF